MDRLETVRRIRDNLIKQAHDLDMLVCDVGEVRPPIEGGEHISHYLSNVRLHLKGAANSIHWALKATANWEEEEKLVRGN